MSLDPTFALTLTVILIALLLVLSAFFSGSETALTAASLPVIYRRARAGDPRAALVERMYDQKERLIGTLLLGNNLVNIFASSLATGVLISMFGDAGIYYATLVMTLLVLIFAEILPKTYAFHHADRMALTVAPIIALLVFVFSPITRTLQAVVLATMRLVGMGRLEGGGLATTAEELRGAIDLHAGDHKSVKHERAMLRSVLDLNEVEVSEIMVHRKSVVMIDADLPAEQIIDQAVNSPFTRIPLWRNDPDNVIGILHAKALLRAMHEQERVPEAEMELDMEALAGEPWFVPETTLLHDQLQAFRSRREHFAVVVDEYGTMLGVVTLEDILEEIVGDISDEHDISQAGIQPEPNGGCTVEGTVTIRDINRWFEWSLPDEEAVTIAGLILHEARRIPEVGQVFQFHGFRMEVLARKRNQITSIRVTPMRDMAENGDADEMP